MPVKGLRSHPRIRISGKGSVRIFRHVDLTVGGSFAGQCQHIGRVQTEGATEGGSLGKSWRWFRLSAGQGRADREQQHGRQFFLPVQTPTIVPDSFVSGMT